MHNKALGRSIYSPKSDHHIFVKCFIYGALRFVCVLISSALLVALLGNYIANDFSEFVIESINYEENIKKRYEHYQNVYKESGESYNVDYSIFYSRYFEGSYKKDLIFIAISHTIWLVPLLFLIFWRSPPPICFDRERKLIYTWSWGKCYCARFDQLRPTFPKVHILDLHNDKGSLEISLFAVPSGKEKRFRLGAYFAYPHQNAELYQWLKDYWRDAADASEFHTRRNTWIEKCPLPPRQLPLEKMQPDLAAYADAHPDTNPNPNRTASRWFG